MLLILFSENALNASALTQVHLKKIAAWLAARVFIMKW